MLALLLTLMLEWKMPDESVASKLQRFRPLVEAAYAECKKYEKQTKVHADTCLAIAINTAYWETGLQEKLQLNPKTGPSGEECYFQIHRAAEQIPFPQWKPIHQYGTRHGKDIRACVADGVRILSYHLWRCRIDEKTLRSTSARYKLYILYSQYYRPDSHCYPTFYRGKKAIAKNNLLRRRAAMAARLLKKTANASIREE